MFGDPQLRTLWWEAYSTLWKEGVLVQADTGAVSLPAIEGVEMLYPAARGNRRLSLQILRTYKKGSGWKAHGLQPWDVRTQPPVRAGSSGLCLKPRPLSFKTQGKKATLLV